MQNTMSDEVQTHAETDRGYIAYLFTNDRNHAFILHQMLEMFHNGVLQNTIGLMDAKNTETDEVETLIVGVEHDGDQTFTFPLARILTPAEGAKYQGPDGQGGFLGGVDVDPVN
jgi:hypothetical protein